MPSVIHSDQGREFENHLMQELCLLCGAHKTWTTPYHPASDGLVERFNRTLLMMLAMFSGSELLVESLESVHITQDCLSVDVGVVLPELSPVVSARTVAVPMSFADGHC